MSKTFPGKSDNKSNSKSQPRMKLVNPTKTTGLANSEQGPVITLEQINDLQDYFNTEHHICAGLCNIRHDRQEETCKLLNPLFE
jgi:hypothetical protein